MLSSGANVIIWDKMLSSKAHVIMVSSGANVIIWCYHVMLSSGMITPPFFVFPGNFTNSGNRLIRRAANGKTVKGAKCENFHRTVFLNFYTIKPLWVGDFRAKIKNSKF
jgi:hypothetical protein